MSGRRPESRKSARRKSRTAAWISYWAGATPIPCVLWDMSDGGARITVAYPGMLPEMFMLALSKSGGEQRLCQVVWRNSPHIGIRFIAPEEAREAPLKSAVVNRAAYSEFAVETRNRMMDVENRGRMDYARALRRR